MAKVKKTASKTAQKPKKAESVVISMVLDESGSMAGLAESTISGFNEYVSTLKRDLADQSVHFSAIKFDSNGVVKLQVGAPIKDAIRLSRENYQPRGGTPLLDAVGRTIQATDEVAGKNKASKIIVVIQTDGEENASQEFTIERVKSMVEERQGKGWEFVFIGAGLNAFAAGTAFGIRAMNTMSYGANAANTEAVFRASAAATTRYGTGMADSAAYLMQESAASGESASILRQKMAATPKGRVK